MTSSKHTRRQFLHRLQHGALLAAGVISLRNSHAHWTPPVMSWKEWASHDALGLAELVRSGEVTALEVAEQTMHATHLINPTTNAVLEFYYDKLAHGASDNLPDGIFHGAPYFFKDVGQVEQGRVSEWGRKDYLGRVMQEDTDYIRRLRRSGLNFLGRAAAPEVGTSPVTESLLNGYTHNPWKLGFSPGGSSGGSASAVASGILPMAAANDGGGSTRIPASVCGNVGLKHTRRIARVFSGDPDTFSLVSNGVNTRSVRDTAAFLDAALHPQSSNAQPGAPDSYLIQAAQRPRQLRIALSSGRWGPYQAPDDALAEMQRIGAVLRKLGHRVEEADAPIDHSAFYNAFKVQWTAGTQARLSAAELKQLEEPPREPDYSQAEPVTRMIYADGQKWTREDYIAAIDVNQRTTQILHDFFSRYDLYLTPTVGTHTPELGSRIALSYGMQSIEEWWHHTWSFIPYTPLGNFSGHPAISLPVAKFADGMPLGAHFMGAYNSEVTLLQIAAQLERELPWFDDHPPFHVTAFDANARNR